jgi:integrase
VARNRGRVSGRTVPLARQATLQGAGRRRRPDSDTGPPCATEAARRPGGKARCPASKTTVSEAAHRWLDSRRGRVRVRTLEADARGVDYLKRYFGTRRLQDVSPADIAAYLGALRAGKVGASGKKLSEWTCVGALKTARAIFGAAVLGGLAVDPTTRLQKYVRPKPVNARQPLVLTAEQVDSLVAAAVKKCPAYAPIIATLAYTGGRVREILALRWRDVDHAAGLIHIKRPADGRGHLDGRPEDARVRAVQRDRVEAGGAPRPQGANEGALVGGR